MPLAHAVPVGLGAIAVRVVRLELFAGAQSLGGPHRRVHPVDYAPWPDGAGVACQRLSLSALATLCRRRRRTLGAAVPATAATARAGAGVGTQRGRHGLTAAVAGGRRRAVAHGASALGPHRMVVRSAVAATAAAVTVATGLHRCRHGPLCLALWRRRGLLQPFSWPKRKLGSSRRSW